MNNHKHTLFRPNFYHIPTIVASQVNAHESFVFSVIYWIEKMKDGKCFASNNKIAKALPYKSSPQSVANALCTLEEKGLIKRIFNDSEKRIRSEIITLVDYSVIGNEDSSVDDTASPTGDGGITHRFKGYNPQVNIIEISNNKTNNKTDNNSNDVAFVIKLFEKLDVKNKKYYGNKTQRANAKILLDEYGVEKISKLIDVYLKAKGEKYLPSISSPYDMVEKMSKLEDFFLRKKADLDEIKNNVIWTH